MNSGASPLMDMLHLAMNYWYVFLLSLIVCVSVGYMYSNSLTRKYKAQAKILIKGADNSTSNAMFQEMGVGNKINSIENEIAILRSTSIIGKVVERLDLTTDYIVEAGMNDRNIYGANPVAIEWIDKGVNNMRLVIDILSAQRYCYKLVDDVDSKVANFGDTVKFNNSSFVLRATESWGNSYSSNRIFIDLAPSMRAVSYLKNSLVIYRDNRTTGTIFISMTDTNIERAKDIVSVLIETYNENDIFQKSQIAIDTEEFIDNRISLIYNDLGAIDSQLEGIKRKNKVTDLSSAGSAAYAQRVRYEDELRAVELQTEIIQSVRKDLNIKSDNFKLVPPNKLFADIGISEQINQYNELATKLIELAPNSGERNPIFLSLKKEVQLAKDNLIIATDNLYRSLKLQKDNLLQNSQEASSQLSNFLGSERVVNDVMRERGIKEQLYLYLLNKREVNAMQLSITEAGAIVIEPTSSNGNPVFPNVMFILLVSVVVGVSIPVAMLILMSLADNKIRSKDYIEEHSSIPSLGIIIKKPKVFKNSDIVVGKEKNEIIGEVFGMVCSEINLYDYSAANKARVIQIVSGLENEGKTFTSANLALTYAYSDKRVLVIDGDLRRRGLSKLLNPKTVGFDKYLIDESVKLSDIIERGVMSNNLDCICLGKVLGNPKSLLMSKRFEEMIDELRNEYDYIIIDSTPFFVVADAQITNRVVDQTIWIMRAGVTRKAMLGEIEKINDEKKLVNVSILLTDVDVRSKRYKYNYRYSYDYSYAYVEKR